MKQNWVHFIGVAGVATGQIAVEYKRQGWFVTGSDKGFFPPMSIYLKEKDICFLIGYKEKNLDKNSYYDKNIDIPDHPDMVIMCGGKGMENSEFLYAKKMGIPIKYFPEIVKENILVADKSIVVAGTYGKSTITSMLTHIFNEAQIEISYMFGALNINGLNGVRFKSENTKYSIVEGDEYIDSLENKKSKFFYYNPNFVILNSIEWDHTDVFKSKEEYVENFKKFLSESHIENIVYNPLDKNILSIIDVNDKRFVPYNEKYKNIELFILGEYNKNNAIAAATMAEYSGIDDTIIRNSLKSYKGLKRRLEIKYKTNGVLVIDDFGSSASKARKTINSVKIAFPDRQIIGIFEPNLGSRTQIGIGEYKAVFNGLDELFLPRFTKVQGDYLSNQDLAEFVEEDVKVSAISSDRELINQIQFKVKNSKSTIILFMGSHGFRGMISELVNKLEINNDK